VKKKKILWGVLSVLLTTVIICSLYVVSGIKTRENSILIYLLAQGYTRTEIQDIEARHSFINVILGYPEWTVAVIFEDEPSVVYNYSFSSDGKVTQTGVSGGDTDMGKEDLKHSEPSSLQITVGKSVLSYVVGLNQWNESEYDREDNFKLIMKGVLASDLPLIELGETISIEFLGQVPDSTMLTECLLQSDGTQKFTIEDTIDIDFSSGQGSFILEKNMSVAFSSNSADFMPGASIRGFRLICKWGNNECEYAFVIRSDPPFTSEIEK
jgi:hypothetical protein